MTNDQPEGVCAPLVLGVGQPTNGDGYLIVARELLPAVEVLSTADKIPPRGCALIAGHTLECTLKAYLWHKGKRDELKCKKVRHNITEVSRFPQATNRMTAAMRGFRVPWPGSPQSTPKPTSASSWASARRTSANKMLGF
jgi:hypothetical protein